MKAVVIATGYCQGGTPAHERYPTALLPLVDRPFIQHVVEFLVDQGIDEFDFVLGELPDEIEGLLGDGTRWGSRFRFHLARDSQHPYGMLQHLEPGDPMASLLLVHADRLPQVDLAKTRPVSRGPVLFCWGDQASERVGDPMRWTGWAWVQKGALAGVPDGAGEKELAWHLLSIASHKGALVRVPEPLTVQTYRHVMAAHQTLLADRFQGLMVSGREVEDGVWLGRNVHLHPTAHLAPPVYIGENSRIGAGAHVGPHASIGCNSMIDENCSVENSVVFPGSYVGGHLALNHVMVDRNRLIDVERDTEVLVPDAFILGSLSGRHLSKWISGAVSRAVAGLLLALTWPILMGTALCLRMVRAGPALRKKDAVRLPAPLDRSRWRTFGLWRFAEEGRTEAGLRHVLLEFLPGLINIFKGDISFVGVPPRNREAVERLSRDWQNLYLDAQAGIITEAYVRCGASPGDDECYAADAFYAVSSGLKYDLGLVVGYLGRLLKNSVEHKPVSHPMEKRYPICPP